MANALAILAVGLALSVASAAYSVPISLGTFVFDSALFGDSLSASDGGIFAASNWLNVAKVDPGTPGNLTGPGFDTGVANIGSTPEDWSLVIGYGTGGIRNGPGDDLGVVVARFSSDSFPMAVSTDGGSTFSTVVTIGAATATPTGVARSYFYGAYGDIDYLPLPASLWVHAIDLSTFGVPPGGTVDAVRIDTGIRQGLDLIRVAGFLVPEPGIVALLATGLVGFATAARCWRIG